MACRLRRIGRCRGRPGRYDRQLRWAPRHRFCSSKKRSQRLRSMNLPNRSSVSLLCRTTAARGTVWRQQLTTERDGSQRHGCFGSQAGRLKVSAFGWLLESLDPCPAAYRPHEVATGLVYGNRRIRSRLGAIVTGLIVTTLAAVIVYRFLEGRSDWEPLAKYFFLLGLIPYVLIGYSTRIPVTARYRPHSIAGNLQNLLVMIKLALLPGRFLGIGMIDLYRAFTCPGVTED